MDANKLKNLRFSGIVECAVKAGEEDPASSILNRLGGSLKHRKRQGGFYAFKGGFIQPIQTASRDLKRPLTPVTLRFKESRISFLDKLVEAATMDKEECKLTYSLRCRKMTKKVTLTPSSKGRVTVVTYPRVGLITVQGVFGKNASKPGETIKEILKEGWRNGRGI
jgi:hypothetical protein